jgi:hypothetical protein
LAPIWTRPESAAPAVFAGSFTFLILTSIVLSGVSEEWRQEFGRGVEEALLEEYAGRYPFERMLLEEDQELRQAVLRDLMAGNELAAQDAMEVAASNAFATLANADGPYLSQVAKRYSMLFEAMATKEPHLCREVLVEGNEKRLAEVVPSEYGLLDEALIAAYVNAQGKVHMGSPTYEETADYLSKALQGPRRISDADLQAIQMPEDASDPQTLCVSFSKFYQNISELPPDEGGLVMRYVLGDASVE